MTLIGFSWSKLKAVFFADHVLLNGFFLFLGKWVYEVVMNVVERRMQGAELLMQILVWSSLSAFVTAVAGVLTLATPASAAVHHHTVTIDEQQNHRTVTVQKGDRIRVVLLRHVGDEFTALNLLC